jgi:hypothetical protein
MSAEARMAFAKGHPKVGGRQRGTPNKLTGNAREVARDLLGNAEYQQNLQRRLIRGEAPRLEVRLWEWVLGKPRAEDETPDGAGASGDLGPLLEKLGKSRKTQNPDSHPPAAPAADQGDIEEELTN